VAHPTAELSAANPSLQDPVVSSAAVDVVVHPASVPVSKSPLVIKKLAPACATGKAQKSVTAIAAVFIVISPLFRFAPLARYFKQRKTTQREDIVLALWSRDLREGPWAYGPRASHENRGADFALCGARLQACRVDSRVDVLLRLNGDS
jgi:hypothetical protein